jgi:hypothetical protein
MPPAALHTQQPYGREVRAERTAVHAFWALLVMKPSKQLSDGVAVVIGCIVDCIVECSTNCIGTSIATSALPLLLLLLSSACKLCCNGKWQWL